MKRALTVFLLLAVLSCGALAGTGAVLNARRDAVTITQTVLAGEAAWASDLEVAAASHCGYRMFWESRLALGEADSLETGFSFFPQRQNSYRHDPQLDVSLECFNYGMSTGGTLDLEEDARLSSMRALIEDVAGRTAAGGERTETVDLGDYYDFFPLYASLVLSPSFEHVQARDVLERLLADYFRIPIPESGYRVSVLVGKNADGGIRRIRIDHADSFFSARSQCVADGADLLFALQGEVYDNESRGPLALDGSHIPGGWGVYRLSGVESDRPALSTAYSLPEGAQILYFWGGDDGNKFLLTHEEEVIRLRVLDRACVAPVQTIDLLPFTGLLAPYLGDGFFVVSTVSGPFVLLAREPDGTWAVRLTDDAAPQRELGCALFSGSGQDHMLWDGERLAVTGALVHGWGNSFYVAVYGGEGLRYLARFDHSLDGNDSGSGLSCQPLDDTPRTLSWRGEGRSTADRTNVSRETIGPSAAHRGAGSAPENFS